MTDQYEKNGDMSEQLLLEEALRESKATYQRLYETMTQGVVYQSADGRILDANPAAERILGIRLENMRGRTWMDPQWKIIREDKTVFPGLEHPNTVAIKQGREVGNTIMGVFNPELDDYSWIRVHAVPEFKPGDDRPYRVFTMIDDITRLKRQGDELGLAKLQAELYAEEIREALNLSESQRLDMEEAKQKAEELAVKAEAANMAKTVFLANMSHELKTPLTPILGLTDLLLESAAETFQINCLNDIKQAAVRLFKMVTELLELARLEAGVIVPKRQPFSPQMILELALRNLEPSFFSKGLSVRLAFSENLPKLVEGDDQLLLRLLLILGDNAIKFTEHGEIILGADLIGERSEKVWIRFSVSDTGIGIPEEALGQLFHDFTQVDGSMTRQYGGVGLGLSIVRRLVDMMEGHIWVEKNTQQGVTFFFDLPFDQMGVGC